MSVAVAPDRAPSPLSLWFGYAAMCLGMFMAILDIQIVITSLPVIEEALKIGADRMSWVQTAYLIAEVIAIPLTGLLMRVFSLRWLFAGAIAMFTAASLGCALSGGFASLIVFRVLQGLAGGVLIPMVFSAIFLMFRRGLEQTIATTMGGVLAVLAPALGPITGGLLTEHFSWHWLFLINIGPGLATFIAGVTLLARGRPEFALLARLDWLSLACVAVALGALEIALKEAPDRGWLSLPVTALFAVFALGFIAAMRRRLPVVDFSLLKDRNLAFGCAVSFILGFGLFGSVYLMPVFLAFVRGHGPLEIGKIILVTGIAQLLTAPLAVYLDKRLNPRWLASVGFIAFAIGMAMSASGNRLTDYDEMFWAQVVRGAFVALCILPPTRFALGLLPLSRVADASGLYNLSRNLGGAIGIAAIDTLIFSRSETHSAEILALITREPAAAAALLRIAPGDLPNPDDPLGVLSITDLIGEQALAMAINEAWLMLAGLSLMAVVLLVLLGPIRAGHLAEGDRYGAR